MSKNATYPKVTVSFFCHDGAGTYLFALRSNNCRDEHGKWDNGGGSLEFGETVKHRLLTELREEYNVTPLSYEFLGYRDVLREQKGVSTHWVSLDFRVLVDPTQVHNNEPHKFDQLAWFSLDKIPENTHSQFAAAREQYAAKLI
ncbi:MAG: NUDIX domain-containing protein [Pseudomonadales bacterium]|nr:NUDIX domain-containing protein [Candidatus Woesebacteria bacterium]MCB9801625.1 NUDIX domain-containing protein [Pseudomonadales bacterium]